MEEGWILKCTNRITKHVTYLVSAADNVWSENINEARIYQDLDDCFEDEDVFGIKASPWHMYTHHQVLVRG